MWEEFIHASGLLANTWACTGLVPMAVGKFIVVELKENDTHLYSSQLNS